MTITDDRYAVLSALIDREPVNADAVAAALEHHDGRKLLVSFARLRAAAAREIEFDAAAPQRLARLSRSRWPRAWRLAAALLLPLLVGGAGGYWWQQHEANQPPTPSQIVKFVRGVDWK